MHPALGNAPDEIRNQNEAKESSQLERLIVSTTMHKDADLKTVRRVESDDEQEMNAAIEKSLQEKAKKEKERKERKEKEKKQRLFMAEWNTKYGDMLPDDLVNHIADIIQSKSKKKIGGLFAVQFSSLLSDTIRKSITPEHDSVQILFDRDRRHFFLAHYRADDNLVVIYDSLNGIWKNGHNAMSKIPVMLRKKLYALFGHLFPTGEMRIAIETAYTQQSDAWSCGLRALGCLIDIACDRDPCYCAYSRGAILDLITHLAVTDKKEYDWKFVEEQELGGEYEEVSARTLICFFLYSDCTLMYDPGRMECEEIIKLVREEAEKVEKSNAKSSASQSTPTTTTKSTSGIVSKEHDDDEFEEVDI